jgi:hypothetical protein
MTKRRTKTLEKSSEYTVKFFDGISLEVQDYCHQCPDFEAEVDKERLFAVNGDVRISTTIRCKHSSRCRAIKKYLSKQEGK